MGRRRTITRKPARKRRGKTKKPKRGSAPRTASRYTISVADLQDKLDTRTRELNEAIQRENASAEVLRITALRLASCRQCWIR